MKRRALLLAAAAGAAVAGIVAAATPELFGAADVSTRREVERELQAAIDAYNRVDLDGYMRLYVESPELLYVYRGAALRGTTAVRADFARRFFAGVPPGGRPASERVVVRVQRLDRLGVRDLLATIEVAVFANAGASPAGMSTLVLRRVGERWRVVYEHTS